MSKPDDIPQDVWDAAENTLDTMLSNHGYEGWRADSIGTIAAAILAAKSEEREACAQQVAEYLAEVTVANDEGRELLTANGLRTNETDRRGLLLSTISEDLTAAIRKRGEA